MDLDDLKQPEYTGENRCLPCTVVNLAIAAVVGWLVARRNRVAGVLAVGISVALIYLRGYLVPGTPTLTKRYLPASVLRAFGKEPKPDLASGFGGVSEPAHKSPGRTEPETADDNLESSVTVSGERGDSSPSDGVSDAQSPEVDEGTAIPDLEAYLLEHDVVEPCEEIDDLCLTEAFEDAWFAEMETVDEAGLDAKVVIEAVGFDTDPETFEIDTRDDVQVLTGEHGMAGRWPSRAALLADVAAGRVLEERIPRWSEQEPEVNGQLLNALRMFLERCPSGGDVEMGEKVVESCCSSHDVFAVTCEETGERLFEQRIDDLEP